MQRRNPRDIQFHYWVPKFYFPNRTKVKELVHLLFETEGRRMNLVNYIFCSDADLLEINRRHLNHDTYTDIITFDLEPGRPVVAEIYISVDRVRENALEFHTGFQDELRRVILHGALHLCGYRDKKKKEIILMRQAENKYLSLFGVPRGTKRRSLK